METALLNSEQGCFIIGDLMAVYFPTVPGHQIKENYDYGGMIAS